MTVPGPPCTLPGGHLSPHQVPGLSDLTSPLCPVKRTLKTGHLSSLCCTVGLALFVETWLTAFSCFLVVFWLLLGQKSTLFETMIPCGSHPHMSVKYFIIAGGSYCSVSTSEPWHIKQTKWIKKVVKKTAHFLSTAQSCPHVVGESGGGGCPERCCYWWSKNLHVWV